MASNFKFNNNNNDDDDDDNKTHVVHFIPEPTSDPSSSTAKWRLRNHMAFLVDNLQYYLQAQLPFFVFSANG